MLDLCIEQKVAFKKKIPNCIFSFSEKACLSLVLENEFQEIVSAMFLCNYPNVPALSQSDWLPWMKKLYEYS